MPSPSPSILKQVLEAGSLAPKAGSLANEGAGPRSEIHHSPFKIVGNHPQKAESAVEAAGVEHFRLLMDSAPVAMAMLDLEMRYILANSRWREDFKLGDTEVVGRSHFELFPMLHPGWRHVYDRALSGQVVRCDWDTMMQNGRQIAYCWEVRPWRQVDTRIGGIIISCSRLQTSVADAAATAVGASASSEAGKESGEEEAQGQGQGLVDAQMHGSLEALWGSDLPMLSVDAQGRILRASVGASTFLLPKGLREGVTTLWEALGERAQRGALQQQVEGALRAVLVEGKAQEALGTSWSSDGEWSGEIPAQWLFARISDSEALVMGLEGAPVLPPPSVGVNESTIVSEESDEAMEMQRRLIEAADAERLSRQRENRLRAVLDLAPCGLLVLDEKAGLIFQNERLKHLLGRAMVEGQRVEDWLIVGCRDGSHRKEVIRRWQEDVWRRQLVQVLTVVSADDLLKDIELRPVMLPGGGMMVMLQDVTEATRSEEMLRSTEAKFRTLVHENPLPVVMTDRSGAVFDVNPAAEMLLGYPRAELRRMRLAQWMGEDTVKLRSEILREMVLREATSGDMEAQLCGADGRALPVRMRLAVILDADRRALFTVHFMQEQVEFEPEPLQLPVAEEVALEREVLAELMPEAVAQEEWGMQDGKEEEEEADEYDFANMEAGSFLLMDEHPEEVVGERKRVQARVPLGVDEGAVVAESSRSRSTSTIVGAPGVSDTTLCALAETDAHGRVTEWTAEAEELFGYASAEMVGRGLHALFRPSDQTGFYQELAKNHALALRGKELEWTFYHKETGRGQALFVLEAVGDSPLMVRLKRKLVVAASAVADEVDADAEPARSEVTEVRMGAVFTEQGLEQQRLVIGETHQRVKDQLQIINSMLNLQLNTVRNEEARRALRSSQNRIGSMAALHQHLSRLAAGEEMNFASFATGLVSRLRECFEIDEQRVEVHLHLPGKTVPERWLLPLALALNEMVSNVFKHAFADGREGSLRVALEWDEFGMLSVTDDGTGLPAGFDDHPHEGMGMKILRVFAGQLGGEIKMENRLEGGLEVALQFPVSEEDRLA